MHIEPYPSKVCLVCYILLKKNIFRNLRVIIFQLSFRGKERIRYLKQKTASGKGFHVVSKLLSAMLHHIIGLAPPTLYTVSSCTHGLRKF